MPLRTAAPASSTSTTTLLHACMADDVRSTATQQYTAPPRVATRPHALPACRCVHASASPCSHMLISQEPEHEMRSRCYSLYTEVLMNTQKYWCRTIIHACLQLDATALAVYTACGSLLIIIYRPVACDCPHSLEGRSSIAIHAVPTALLYRRAATE
jgi:hypothetical protein